MLRLVAIAGRVMLGAGGLLLTGCAYRDYDRGRYGYDGPVQRGYYERVDYRYGDRHYDRDGYRHHDRYNDRYGRCD